MKILVTGATGFVGRAVCEALSDRGIGVRRLARMSRGTAKSADRLETVAGSVLNPKTLRDAFRGCDAVIHLVGIISECREQTFEAVHVGGTRNVLAAAREAGVSRYVHMSALGSRPEAPSRYHRSKWAAEELVHESGMAWTIFRPSVIYGAGGGFTELLGTMIRLPVVPVIGSGRALLQPVAVEDVARCFAMAAGSSETAGRTFDLCGMERLSFVELLEAMLDVDERKKRRRLLLHVPEPLARMQARFLEWFFPRVLGKAPPLNRDQILMLAEDNVGDPEPAMEAFGFRPLNFRERIASCL